MKNVRPALENVPNLLKHERKVLLAISGGGDSVAMLHYFANLGGAPELYVATVDHSLRPESASEAKFVAGLCKDIRLPHDTLSWNPGPNVSSQDARLARYGLLARHALKIGATAIALAHTLDDQAETLVMRGQRMNEESGTRGLAGIPERAAYAPAPGRSVALVRPLLAVKRSDLRQYLREWSMQWIDDPSNEDPDYERVRTRQMLAASSHFPNPEKIAKLASLSAQGRHWLNRETGRLLRDRMTVHADGSLSLETSDAPYAIVETAFATLITVAGGLQHRSPPAKISALVEAFRNRDRLRNNIGRALVTVSSEGAHFQREARNRVEVGDERGPIDGRFFVDANGQVEPFIKAFERFRPRCDDVLREVVMEKLRQPSSQDAEPKQFAADAIA